MADPTTYYWNPTTARSEVQQGVDGGSYVAQSGIWTMRNSLGLAPFDAASLVQTSLVDTWSFFTGGLPGTLTNTVTITYTDPTKANISTLVKT
jgi:hypothetical protein